MVSVATTAEYVVEDAADLFHFWHKQFECPDGLCDGSGKLNGPLGIPRPCACVRDEDGHDEV